MREALDKALFDEITAQLKAKAIRVKTGTLVDATIIASAQGASPDTDGLPKSLAPISAVGEHLARCVRQSIRAGLAVIDIGRGDRDFLDQSRVGVGAHMSLEPMDRRPSLVLDPTRLAILFARGRLDGGSQASLVGGATGPVFADPRGRAGS